MNTTMRWLIYCFVAASRIEREAAIYLTALGFLPLASTISNIRRHEAEISATLPLDAHLMRRRSLARMEAAHSLRALGALARLRLRRVD